MKLNFREALVTLSRALPLVLFRAGVFVAGGFAVIILFAMLLIASRLAAGAGQTVAVGIALLAIPTWWAFIAWTSGCFAPVCRLARCSLAGPLPPARCASDSA